MDPTKPPLDALRRPRWGFPTEFVLLAVMTTAAAWPALAGEFLRDDALYVIANAQVTTPVSASEVWGTPFQPDSDLGLWRPLTTHSLRLDFLISTALLGHGLDSRVYHATNVLWTVVAALLFASILRCLHSDRTLAWLGGILYAVLAGKSEALLWISGRAELLLAAFALGAVRLALTPGWIAGAACIASAAAGAAAKEQGFLTILLLPFVPRPRKEIGLRLLGSALLLGVLLWLRVRALGGRFGPDGIQQILPNASFLERAPLAAQTLTDFLRLLVWPHPLLNEYDDPELGDGGVKAWIGLGLAVGAILLALRAPATRLSLALAFIPLLPTLNLFVRTGEPFAERFLTLPAAGFLGLIAVSLRRIPRAPAYALLALLSLCHLARTHLRAPDFRSELALATAQVRDAPDLSGGHILLGRALELAAVDLDPNQTAEATQLRDQAHAAYTSAARLRPDSALAALMLARFELKAARPRSPDGGWNWARVSAAERAAQAASDADHRLAEPLSLRAEIALLRNQTEPARAFLQEALRRDRRSLGSYLALLRMIEPASPAGIELRRAFLESTLELTRLRPHDCRLASLAAQAFLAQGRNVEARAAAARATDLARGPTSIAETAIQRFELERSTGREAEARLVLDSAAARLLALREQGCVAFDAETALGAIRRVQEKMSESREAWERARAAAVTPDQRRRLRALPPP